MAAASVAALHNQKQNDANIPVLHTNRQTPTPDAVCATYSYTFTAADPTLPGGRFFRDDAC